MGFFERRIMLRVVLVLSILFGLAIVGEMRPLLKAEHHHQYWFKPLITQVLPRGGNDTPSPNPCTNIPGHSSGNCHN
uniref:Transmembrane protein n=1 Tax=Cannabis sativa TaxID=3483 RepID=A0A803R375_CANSA